MQNMNQYELALLVTKKEDADVVKDYVTKLSGKITKEEVWEKRKLAYSIKHNDSGIYIFLRIDIDIKHVMELRKRLQFNDTLLRFLLLSIDEIKK